VSTPRASRDPFRRSRTPRTPRVPPSCLLALLFAQLIAAACSRPSPQDELGLVVGLPAPVVLVVVGSLRADRLDLDPAGPTRTPFLAGLAAEGIVFERAYAAAGETRAAVASLLTGLTPGRHGCVGPNGRLGAGSTLLSEALAELGYDTRAVVADPDLAPEFGFGRGWRSYRLGEAPRDQPYADALRIAGQASEDIEALLPPPSLLFVNVVDPHWPLQDHPEDGEALPPGSFDGSIAALAPYWRRAPGPASVRRAVALYDGEIEHVDRQLEGLAGRLAQRGLAEGAWIVVTSDHGLGLWDHGRFGHTGQLHETQIRVPLIVRPPRGLSRTLRVAEPVSLIDLAPTLLELLGGSPPPSMEGRSWVPALTGQALPPVRPVLVEAVAGGARLAAMIDGRHKLLLDRATGESVLYDVLEDPLEQAALVLTPGSEAAAAALRLLQRLEVALREADAGDEPSTEEVEVPGWLRSRIATLDAGESGN
jgi:arylsulfatase A-like enzyme